MSSARNLPGIGLRGVVRRRLLVLVFVPLVVLASVISDLRNTTPLYRADAELLISPSLAELLFDPLGGRLSRLRTLNNAIRVINSPQVSELAAERLGFPGGVSAGTDDGSDVITLSAVDSDPAKAARIATAFGEAYLVHRRVLDIQENETIQAELNRQLAADQRQMEALDHELNAVGPERQAKLFEQQAPQRAGIAYSEDGLRQQLRQVASAVNVDRGGATLTRRAEIPRRPFEPRPARSLGLGAISGLLLGAGLALVLDALDRRVHSSAAAAEAAGVQVLAELGPETGGADDTTGQPEAFRRIRSVLSAQMARREGNVVIVYAAHDRAGTTTTVAGLATALAAAGNRVIALDANLRRPRLHEALGVDGRVGLTSVLLGEVRIEDALQSSAEQPRLRVLPAGKLTPSAPDLLSGVAFSLLLREVRSLADVVVLDGPAARAIDASAIRASVDFEVLVTQLDRTTFSQIARAVEGARRQQRGALLGLVVRTLRPSFREAALTSVS